METTTSFECPICGAISADDEGLQYHGKNEHGDEQFLAAVRESLKSRGANVGEVGDGAVDGEVGELSP